MTLRPALNVVLHQTRSPDNLGAVARIMANFGFSKLHLSDPSFFTFTEAEKMAVKADQVLASKRVYPSLRDALGGVVYAVGSTSRTVEDRPAITPEECARRLLHHSARGDVALVLGGEQRGLSDAELEHCQDIVVIPTGDVQPSMNLAQAGAVLLYLCSAVEREDTPAATTVSPPEGAKLGAVQALETRMREVLLAAGFLNPQAPDHILHELTRSLLRGQLSQREAELWLAAFKQLGRVTSK